MPSPGKSTSLHLLALPLLRVISFNMVGHDDPLATVLCCIHMSQTCFHRSDLELFTDMPSTGKPLNVCLTSTD